MIVQGLRGVFTAEAFRALLEAGCGVSGLIVAGPRGAGWRRLHPQRVLAAHPPTAVELAWDAGLPVIEIGWVDASALAALDALEPDVLAIACFPWLLPKAWRQRPPRGCVNVHPSLLPAFPGTRAIEEALAAGVETTGVTVHYVDEGMDTGPVIRQEPVPLEPRSTLKERIHAVEHELLPAVVRELCAR